MLSPSLLSSSTIASGQPADTCTSCALIGALYVRWSCANATHCPLLTKLLQGVSRSHQFFLHRAPYLDFSRPTPLGNCACQCTCIQTPACARTSLGPNQLGLSPVSTRTVLDVNFYLRHDTVLFHSTKSFRQPSLSQRAIRMFSCPACSPVTYTSKSYAHHSLTRQADPF